MLINTSLDDDRILISRGGGEIFQLEFYNDQVDLGTLLHNEHTECIHFHQW